MGKSLLFFKGRAKNFSDFACAVENKYYGWTLADIIKDLKDKNCDYCETEATSIKHEREVNFHKRGLL